MPPIHRTPAWPVSRYLPCCSQDEVEFAQARIDGDGKAWRQTKGAETNRATRIAESGRKKTRSCYRASRVAAAILYGLNVYGFIGQFSVRTVCSSSIWTPVSPRVVVSRWSAIVAMAVGVSIAKIKNAGSAATTLRGRE